MLLLMKLFGDQSWIIRLRVRFTAPVLKTLQMLPLNYTKFAFPSNSANFGAFRSYEVLVGISRLPETESQL